MNQETEVKKRVIEKSSYPDMSAKDGGGAVSAPNSSTPELQGSHVAKTPSAVASQLTAASMATSKNSSVGAKPTLVKKVAEPKSPKVRIVLRIW